MSQSSDTSFADYLNVYTFEYILDRMLSQVPDSLDKREGSIIWDALAPAAAELAKMYIELKSILINTYPSTAVGQYLDLRVQERGITRYEATYAVKLGTFTDTNGNPAEIPIGSRFSSVSDTAPLNYVVTAAYEVDGIVQAGKYRLTCEEAGTAGNSYIGNLLPISNVTELQSALLSELLIPARDKETDDELYDRYLEKISATAFGGSVTQYRDWILGISGVGAVQVYPTWNGGGTVKCSIIGADFGVASQDLIDTVQTAIDPILNHGEGIGQAPIGHSVTVTTATETPVNISIDATLEAGYTEEQIKAIIEPILSDYLLSLRKQWGNNTELNNYSLSLFRANLIGILIVIPQILNITEIRLNGADADLFFTETAQLQELPVLGTVTVNAQ